MNRAHKYSNVVNLCFQSNALFGVPLDQPFGGLIEMNPFDLMSKSIQSIKKSQKYLSIRAERTIQNSIFPVGIFFLNVHSILILN